MVAFSHCLRNELRGTGVSVSVICPGFVTDAGMFFASAIRKHGAQVSPLMGTSRPEHVARAVLRALRNDSIELPVNPGPVRFIMALNQLAPGAVSWVQDRVLGVNTMMRKVALGDRNQS